MKKALLILAALAFILVPSCTKQVEEEPEGQDLLENVGEEGGEQQGGTVEFEATLLETKTHLGDEITGQDKNRRWPNLWSEGDAINVNGVPSNAIASEYVGKDHAFFTMTKGVSGPYYGAYPASAVKDYSNRIITIPAVQTFTDGNYDPAAYIMVGNSTTTSIPFNPVMGLIQLTTTAPDGGGLFVKSISVEPVDSDEKISGDWTTDYDKTITSCDNATNTITISAPSGTAKDFGTVFTFAVPAKEYSSGLRFRITAVPNDDGTGDEQTMVFAKQSAFDVAAGTLYPLTAPAFKESAISLSCKFLTSSSAGFEWSSANTTTNVKKVWRLAIYDKEACTPASLVVQHDIPADPNKSGVWNNQGDGKPRFIVGGLGQGQDYWCKLTDVANDVSTVLKFTTETFVPVPASNPSGNTLVAEDFSEFGWGPAWLYGVSGYTFGGWAPVATGGSNLSCAAPSGIVTTGSYIYNEHSANLCDRLDFTTAPRFNAGWGFVADDIFWGYIQAGFLRIGGKNADRQLVVLPALSGIKEGKYATVDVTVTVAHSNNSDITNNKDFAVFIERGLTLSNATKHLYTGAALNRRYPVSLENSGHASSTLTFRVNGVKNTDRLMVGPYNKVTNYNRYFLYNVTVTKVSESDTETMDITDSETLELFRTRVANGESSLNGNVINDITVSSSVASDWVPIPNYTGRLDGNNHTITGLTKPLFADLKGSVSGLTIESEISSSDAADTKWGVLAKTFNGGTVSNCTSQGSITYSATSYSANCNIGGLIGEYQGGTITGCHNSCSITFSATGANQTFIGGIVANNTISGKTLNDCHSTGGTISYTGSTTGGNLYIGGIVGYSTKEISNCTNAMTLNIGGTISGTETGKFYATGGIVGSMSANKPITSCLNTGNINWSQVINEVSKIDSYSFLGGVAGRVEGSITNSSNGGTVTYSGKNHSKDPFIGGVVGSTTDASISISGKYSSASATNYGSVIVNTSSQTKKGFCIGGVAGRLHNNSSMTATNNGPVTITKLTCTSAYIGGLVGNTLNSASTVNSGSANMSGGVITVTDLTTKGYNGAYYSCWIGGAVGYANGAVTANNAGKLDIKKLSSYYLACIGGVVGFNSAAVSGNNSGDVVVSSSSSFTKTMYIGGIVGRGEAAISNCTNSGSVSNAAPMNDTAGYLQLGGIVGYNTSASSISSCHNTGAVSNTGNAAGYLYVGGISSETDAAISNCDNTGAVSNSGNSANNKPIRVGGIAGHANAAITSSSNGTSSATGGKISNNGTSSKEICVGGIAGMNTGKTFTTCYNKGEVTNSGDAPDSCIVVGGLVGLSLASSSYVAPCYNTGAISNTGTAADWLDVGGLIGWAYGANTLSGSPSVYNYNSGTVTDNSESSKPYVGGICGEVEDGASNLTYCTNRSGGALTVKNNTRVNISVGGIVAGAWNTSTLTCTSNAGAIYVQNITGSNCINVGGILGITSQAVVISGSDANHRTTNSGNIQFKTCTYSGALRVGGVLGTWDHNDAATIQYCSNSGTISTYTTSTTSADLNATSSNYSGIGGVVGTNANYDKAGNKTISDCNNSGNITIYSAGAFYIGGVTGCARNSISNCSSTGNITYGKGSTSKKGKCMIGGVVGYGWSLGASGLYFKGTVDAHEADYSKETGVSGLIGEQNSNSTFTSCKIGGTIWGGSVEGSTGAGLFICPNSDTKRSSTYTSCIVKTGTIVKYDSSTKTTINSTSNLTQTNLHGRMGQSNTNKSGISVGSID